MFETTAYTNGQSDGTSQYALKEKSGKTTYFASDGRILGIVDRYNNTIQFTYSTISYTVGGNTSNKRLITQITDTVGRVFTIAYNQDQTFTSSLNGDGTVNGDLQGKFNVVITLPDGQHITYEKSGFLFTAAPYYVIRTKILNVYDLDGAVKYTFSYNKDTLGFTYTNGTTYSMNNSFESMNGIIFGKSNLMKVYTYGTYTKGLGSSGSMQYRKVTEKDEQQKTAYDSSQTVLLNRYTRSTVAATTYTYTNEPDGYGYSGYSTDQNYLKNTYRYYTEVQDPRGAHTKYTYDGLSELIETLDYGNDHKEDTTRTYDTNKLPSMVKRVIYNVVNGQAGTNTVTKIENYW